MSLSLFTYLEGCVNSRHKKERSFGRTVDRIALVRDLMRPLFRQKHTKQVLESDHPNRVSKS